MAKNPDLQSRRPKNEAEGLFFDLAQGRGWQVTKRGWPDFFCIRDDECFVVEVKPSKAHRPRDPQFVVMKVLSSYGIPCFMWSPDGGLVRWMPDAEYPNDPLPDTSDGDTAGLVSRISSLPRIGEITDDPALTAETILDLYSDFGDEWVFGVMAEVHQWCEGKIGTGKLNAKRNGHRFLLNWYKRAKKWYQPKFNPGQDGDYADVGF